jgi:hypothetical protein
VLAVNNCTQGTCHTLQSMCIYVHTLYTAYIQYWLCLHTLVSGSENLLRRLEFRQHVLQSTSACLRAAHLQAARPTPPTNSLATNIGLRDTSLKCVVATAASLQRQAGRRGGVFRKKDFRGQVGSHFHVCCRQQQAAIAARTVLSLTAKQQVSARTYALVTDCS